MDFSMENIDKNLELISNQGVTFTTGATKLRDGWYSAKGFLSDPMFEGYPEIMRWVSVVFLNMNKGELPRVDFINCTGEFERRVTFTLDSLDEIPDYSGLSVITRDNRYRSSKDGRLFTPPNLNGK